MRKRIGIVFQDIVINDWLTAVENFNVYTYLYRILKEEWQPRVEEILKF